MILTNNKKNLFMKIFTCFLTIFKKNHFCKVNYLKSRVCPAYGTVVPNVHVPM